MNYGYFYVELGFRGHGSAHDLDPCSCSSASSHSDPAHLVVLVLLVFLVFLVDLAGHEWHADHDDHVLVPDHETCPFEACHVLDGGERHYSAWRMRRKKKKAPVYQPPVYIGNVPT